MSLELSQKNYYNGFINFLSFNEFKAAKELDVLLNSS